MSIRSGLDDRYDLNIFNSDAWKAVYEYITKQYVDDNFANLYTSNAFRGFNYFQNGLSWSGGVLQADGSIVLSDASGNTITINKTKLDAIDASLNYLDLNKASKTEVTTAVNNMKASILNGAGPAYDTLLEIQNELIANDTLSTQIVNTLATKAPINNPSFTGTVSGVTKSMVGLGNVSDIAPLNLPISTATQSALNLKANITDLNLKANITDLNLKANINNPTFTGNLSIPSGDITCRDITARAVTLTGNISMPNNTITAKEMSSSNLLLQGDNTNGYIRPTNNGSTLYLGANNKNLIAITENYTYITNYSSFSKGMVITDTAPNLNVSLRSVTKTGQLNFLAGSNAGNYNPICGDNDSSIIYHTGSKDSGTLNIMNWSDQSNGLKLTKQKTTIYNNVEIGGNITSDGYISCSNFKSYVSNDNNISSILFPSNFGTTDLPCFSCSVPSNSKINIQVSCPVSHRRRLRQSVGLSIVSEVPSLITEGRNSITANIFKNGTLWKSNVSVTSSTSIPFTQNVTLNNNAANFNLLTGTYEIFIGVQSVSFTPDYQDSEASYEVRLGYDGYVFVDLGNNIVLLSGSGITTNTTISNIVVDTIQVSSYSPTLTGYTISSYSITAVPPDIENIDTGIITSFPNQVLANKISTNSFACVGRDFKAFTGIAGYLVNGKVAMELHHIFCSLVEMKPNDFDTYIIVFAGYKVITYSNRAYNGTAQTFDNRNGTSPQIYTSNNTATSIKVFYMDDEITLPFIS